MGSVGNQGQESVLLLLAGGLGFRGMGYATCHLPLRLPRAILADLMPQYNILHYA
jgi:hypothetical protein